MLMVICLVSLWYLLLSSFVDMQDGAYVGGLVVSMGWLLVCG